MLRIILLFAAAVVAASPAQAEIKTPRAISDGMVLQREKPVKIWGWSEPNAEVEVRFGGKIKRSRADGSGAWNVIFEPMEASGTPREMEFFENGRLSKKISDILVGEVWVLGGQSNMSWPLLPTEGGEAAAARADYPSVRCFRQGRQFLPDVYLDKKFGMFEKNSLCSLALSRTPQKDSPEGSSWEKASPESVPLWSAIGFYFAERLAADLKVPVGLLFTSLGGSPMIAWMPESAAAGNPYLKKRAESFSKAMKEWDSGGYEMAAKKHLKKISDRKEAIAKAKLAGKKIRQEAYRYYLPPSKDSPYAHSSTPFYNFNAKVAPLSGYAVRGILWYQGESDANGPAAENFEGQLETLIAAWRKCFGDSSLPFIQAQLSSYGRGKNWPRVRDAQLGVSQRKQNVYTVCTIDVGDKNDVHPRNKSAVAERMEKIALSEVYGDASVYPFSPVFKCAKLSGGRAEVVLETFGRKVEMSGNAGGFEILSGEKWTPAKAVLEGSTIVFESDGGRVIDGVRYLWSAFPQNDACIRNIDGLPLFPFSFIREK